MKSPLIQLLAFSLSLTPAFAQIPGTYTSYGSSCSSSGKAPPTFTPVKLPVIGGEFITKISNLVPKQCSLLVVGVSDRQYRTLSLPADLRGLGAPGCMLRASLEYCTLFDQPSSSVTLRVVVPRLKSLVSYPIYMQVLSPDIGNNSANIAVSSGAKFVIGG